MSGIALPPGFAASPDRQSSDAEAAAEAQGAEAQGVDGASAPKRRRLGWGQGLARRSAGPDTAQRRPRPLAAEPGVTADGAVDIAADTAAGEQEPAVQPQLDPSAALGTPATPAAQPMHNGHAEPAQPPAAAEPVQQQPPQPPLPSKLELMSTMEKVCGQSDAGSALGWHFDCHSGRPVCGVTMWDAR